MINIFLILVLCFGFTGCASLERFQLYQKYSDIYAIGINADQVTTIVKSENYPEIKDRLINSITASGYTRVIFDDPGHGFIVLAKEVNEHPCQIILKYSKLSGKFNTRIELMKASNDPGSNSLVNEDIEEIAEQIKND